MYDSGRLCRRALERGVLDAHAEAEHLRNTPLAYLMSSTSFFRR
jgi:hypothetical protein